MTTTRACFLFVGCVLLPPCLGMFQLWSLYLGLPFANVGPHPMQIITFDHSHGDHDFLKFYLWIS
jgi:hypothetical protein